MREELEMKIKNLSAAEKQYRKANDFLPGEEIDSEQYKEVEKLVDTVKIGTWKCCRRRPVYVVKEANGNRFLYCQRCFLEQKHQIDLDKLQRIDSLVKKGVSRGRQ